MANKMDKKHEVYLFKMLGRYINGSASKEEVEFLETYYDTFEAIDDLITNENEKDFAELKISLKRTIDQKVAKINRQHNRHFYMTGLRYAAAVLILISVSLAIYFVNRHNSNDTKHQLVQQILPGGAKAILTLANGTEISLANAHNGEIAKQSNVKVIKTAGNELVYASNNINKSSTNAGALQNTIRTPNGGQYEVILPDGTKVTLNAASSLTYPTEFTGHERLVKLQGEGYFEVTKNKSMPFRVRSGGQTVEVLGTHFNINAYSDESTIKTTLLEGSVKVSAGNVFALIVPGEQAVVSNIGSVQISKHTVDVDEETAWRNGLFSFRNDDLRSIMRQLTRWYDIKVVYKGQVPNEKFIGEIPRSSNLSDVIKILELNNIHFETEGRTITVSSNNTN